MLTERELFLRGEACGGRGWAGRGLPRTAAEIVHKHGWRWRAEVKAWRDQQPQEACGGHGPGPWTMERLVDARLRQSARELQEELARGIWG